MKSPPAQTRVSLLASATIAPRSAAASVGLSPAAPVIAPITHSAGRSAASIKPLSPAATLIPVPERAFLRSPYATGSPIAAKRASSSRAAAASAPTFLLALTASTRKRLRSRLSRSIVLAPIEPVAPSSVTVRSVGARSNAVRKMSAIITRPKGRGAADGPQQPSICSHPSLIGAHGRHKLGASERAAGEIGADIGHPHDRKQKEHGEEAVLFVSAQHHRRYRQRARIGDGAGDPGTLLRERERRSPQRAHRQHDDCRPRMSHARQSNGKSKRRPASQQHETFLARRHQRDPFP